jgi:hypothetical protein
MKAEKVKGGPVKETLMYNYQHTAKLEFSSPKLKIRLLFWFL